MPNVSIHIHFLKVILESAVRHDINVINSLQRNNISLQLLQQTDTRVSARQFSSFLADAIRAFEDELVGFSPYPLPLGSWSALTHWVANTSTLGHAIKRFCRFYSLLEKGFKTILVIKGTQASVEIHPWNDGTNYTSSSYELFTFCLYRLLCLLTHDMLPLTQVNLPFAKPKHHREYHYFFYGNKIDFDYSTCSISFPRELLLKPIKQETGLINLLLNDSLYNIIVLNYDRTSWTSKVRDLITANFEWKLGLSDVAFELGIKEHTLRRCLSKEGITYSVLRNQAKRDLAIFLLSNSQHSIEEIAFRTGFSEASAFIRAFKSWTGVTPSTYRRSS
ncbi:MAG: AraC family transcriptional regulator ligand-binding domain-containing protein [Thiohalomonadaceae bacterium]